MGYKRIGRGRNDDTKHREDITMTYYFDTVNGREMAMTWNEVLEMVREDPRISRSEIDEVFIVSEPSEPDEHGRTYAMEYTTRDIFEAAQVVPIIVD